MSVPSTCVATASRRIWVQLFARIGFDNLSLQTYLTAGPKESRAWTIPKGATAPEAAGVIHTDFQKDCIMFDGDVVEFRFDV